MTSPVMPPDPAAGPPPFLPPPEARAEPDGSRRYEGVTYAAPEGYRPLQLDLWVPKSSRPPALVVWVHGGGWLFGDRRHLPETLRPDQLFDALLAAGLAVATVDYRLSAEATFPAQLHDVKAAVRYLRGFAGPLGIDPGRIGIWGESAGGQLAAMAGLTAQQTELEGTLGVLGPSSSVAVVVDWYGPSDMDAQSRRAESAEPGKPPDGPRTPSPEERLVGGPDTQVMAAASPLSHVTAAAPPFLLVHGTADQVVAYQHSAQLAEALTAVGVEVRLEPVPGADHIFAGHDDIDGVVRLSVEWLAAHLAVNAAGPPR